MRPALSIALLPLLTLGLAACGDDDKASDSTGDDSSRETSASYEDTPIDQIGDDVEKAMKDLDTVHLAGNFIDDEGQKILMDITVSREADCEGSMTIGAGSLEIVAVDGVSYFKADEAFWKSQGGEQASVIIDLIGDKWATDSSDTEGFAELCDLDELLSEMNSEDVIGDDNAKVTGTQEVGGQETVTVAFTSDDGNPGVSYIAAEGPHYIVRSDVPEEGAMTFSRFNEPLDVQKPADGEIIDLAELG